MNGDVESGYRNIGYSRDSGEIYEQIKGWKNLHVQERKKNSEYRKMRQVGMGTEMRDV